MMQKLTAPKFNERVSFYKVVSSPKLKQSPDERTLILNCWCYFKSKSVYDVQREKTIGLEDTINFYIRYEHTQQINTFMEVEFKGQTYKIVTINAAESEKDFTLVTAKLTE